MFRLFSLTIISITLFYIIEGALANKLITGKVTHIGQNTIDKNAKVQVQLQDTSLMDAPAKIISTTVITDAKTFPISYTLKYNPSDIKPHHTYSLSVTIEGENDKLLFINNVHTHAELSGSKSPTIDVAVIRVGQSLDNSQKKSLDKKSCAPVKCPGKPKTCPYGYQKKDGCEVCRCNDPCNPTGKPILCGPDKRCFVDKRSDGTFETRCGLVKSHPHKQEQNKKLDSKIICQQPKLTGICKAYMPRFYYNSVKQKCESFVYGGCEGNENNFSTKTQCERTCKA